MFMTFEQFQATRKECADLGKELNDATWQHEPVPARGFIYEGGLYIDCVMDHWPQDAKDAGRYHLLLERSEWITDDLQSLERRLYAWGLDSGVGVLEDAPRVYYISDGEKGGEMGLAELLMNFEDNKGWQYRHNVTDMTAELNGRGWYEGAHEFGHYLVINLDKLSLEYRDQAMDS